MKLLTRIPPPRKILNMGVYRCAHNIRPKKDPELDTVTMPNPDEQLHMKKFDKLKSYPPETVVIPERNRSSAAKKFFLGQFDTDILTYPEVLDKDKYDTLQEMVKPVEAFYEQKVDSKRIDQDAKIPSEILDGLKSLGLYGLQVPEEYGGLGLNATEFAKMNEIITLDGSIAVTLAAHQSIGFKGLLLYGSEELKKKYLPRLAAGEWTAAFCLTESGSGSDAASVKSRAKLSSDGKHWLLSGSKLWISNGGTADFFTVIAQTASDQLDPKNPKRLTAFAVERNFGGVTSGKSEDKHGIRGSNTSEVHFDNTPIPLENVIGEVGDGFKVAVNILNSGRFSMGSACAAVLRKMVSLATDHAINRVQFGKPLKDFELIQDKLAKLAVDIYTMESMAYMTAGLLDSGLYEDCSVEAAMVKVVSSELVYKGISETMQIYGGMGYMKDQPFDVALRDTRILQIFEGTNEILRLFIALSGVQSAGKFLKEHVYKVRNMLKHPNYHWEMLIRRWWNTLDKPKLTLQLSNYLHPTLKEDSIQLEYSVLRFQHAVEILLEKHGANIVDQQFQLQRLANIAIDIYAMSSVLSRASRAYCVGLQHAQGEIAIAQYFTARAADRCKKNVEDILDGEKENGDFHLRYIAANVIKEGGYFCRHPLERTFW